MKPSPGRRPAIAAAVVLLSGGAAVVSGGVSAHAATPTPDHRWHCVSFDVVDRTVNAYTPPQSPHGIGAFATYNGVLSDATDTKAIGTNVGAVNILYVRPSDGHVMQSRSELFQLPGGTVSYLGVEDRTKLSESMQLHSTVQGTSGQYAGMAGHMDWSAHGTTLSNNWTAEHFKLCGRR